MKTIKMGDLELPETLVIVKLPNCSRKIDIYNKPLFLSKGISEFINACYVHHFNVVDNNHGLHFTYFYLRELKDMEYLTIKQYQKLKAFL
jgi:hypothetical protein